MSTVDPVAARRREESRPPGVAVIVAALAAQLLGGLGMGYGWSRMFGDSAVADLTALGLVGAIGGLPLTIISSIVWANLVVRHAGIGLAYGFSAFWLGAAVGVGLADRDLGGRSVLTVLTVLAFVVAAFFLVTGILATRRRRATGRLEDEIVRTGTMTTATVSDKGYEIFAESTRILTTVTFTFTDLHGVQRWVQRPMVVRASQPVVDGQETQLWYDPSDPGNTKRIAVKLAMESPLRGRPARA